jgi:hypothetical protein
VRLGGVVRSRSPSLTFLPENLIQLAFLLSFPCYVKVFSPPLAETSAPRSSILLLLYKIARDQKDDYYCYYFIPKGPEQPTHSKCWREVGSVQDQRGRRAELLSLTLKRKIPAKCLGPGRTVLQGPGSSGLLWGHFSVTCGNSPLCSVHRPGNIFLGFSQNTQQVWG